MIGRALISGGVAALATTVAATIAGRRWTGSYAAPLNATSHFLWGDEAAARNAISVKYTGAGLAANCGASVFWAFFYEALGRGQRRGTVQALRDGLVISAAAYVTDYSIVPQRLTPGFELRLPGAALACIYAALAVGLSAPDLVARRGTS